MRTRPTSGSAVGGVSVAGTGSQGDLGVESLPLEAARCARRHVRPRGMFCVSHAIRCRDSDCPAAVGAAEEKNGAYPVG
jgi:hypothetical protein